MLVLDAEIEVSGRQGRRTLKVEDLHRFSEHPENETHLTDGELIQAIVIPKRDFRRSLYLKIRDRESYEFALASAAVSLDLDGDIVKEARIALGGVAYRPWRAHKAEDSLRGQRLTENAAIRASETAFAEAVPYEHNAFKLPLGKATLTDALMRARHMEI
jgi:xanthine dehydrogenase YagS FAD-binding subunit